jgi:hypothetical protein
MKFLIIIITLMITMSAQANKVTDDGMITFDHIVCSSACTQKNYHQYTIYNPQFKAADGDYYPLGYKNGGEFNFLELKEKICPSFGLINDSSSGPLYAKVGVGTSLISDLFGVPFTLRKKWLGSEKGFVIVAMTCEFRDPRFDGPIIIPPIIIVK